MIPSIPSSSVSYAINSSLHTPISSTLSQELVNGISKGTSMDDNSFLEAYASAYPEMKAYEGFVQVSPEAPIGTGEDKRTARSLLALKWLFEGNYLEFTKGQPEAAKLSPKNFDELAAHFRKFYGSDAHKCDLIMSVMAIHDLGKIVAFQEKVRVASELEHLVNHDDILLVAMNLIEEGKLDSNRLPSYSKQTPEDRALIRAGWEMRLNKGQLIQGENTPANLSEFLKVRQANPEAVELFFDHERLDMMGVLAHLSGCALYNQDLFIADDFAIATLKDLTLNKEDAVYEAYLEKRAQLVGESIYVSGTKSVDPVSFAAARMCATFRYFDATKAGLIFKYFRELPADSLLIQELNISGCSDQTALLLYYSPAVCANLTSSAKLQSLSLEDKISKALALLEIIYRAARALPQFSQKTSGVQEINLFHISNEVKDLEASTDMDQLSVVIDPKNGMAKFGITSVSA